MSFNRHRTFTDNVLYEFKRRERDFGVSGHNTNVKNQSSLSNPVSDDQDNRWSGAGGRTPWVRVSSGVVGYRRDGDSESVDKSDVANVSGIKTITTKVDSNTSEREIHGIVLESTYDSDIKDFYGVKTYPGSRTIAKVLFETTSDSNLLTSDSNLQIFSDRGQPGPVIESVNIRHKNPLGLIKEADIQWRVFTQEQFETLSYFLCNLQKTVVVEVGWSSHRKPTLDLTNIKKIRHMQSNQLMVAIKKTDPDFYNSERSTFNSSVTEQTVSDNEDSFDSMTAYEVEQYKRGTDYDVFIGIIQNYDIQIDDGAYSVTTKLISAAPGFMTSRNDNVFKNYFETKFNTDIERYRLQSDPRVWFKNTSSVPQFNVERRSVGPTEISSEELDAMDDFWNIMRVERDLVFYNKKRATEEIEAGSRGRIGFGKYTPEFISDLVYVSDEELKNAIIRRGRLIDKWRELEPDVPSGTPATVGLLLGAVVGGLLGGPMGGAAGAGLGFGLFEMLADQFKNLENTLDERAYSQVREMLKSIVENVSTIERGSVIENILNSKVRGTTSKTASAGGRGVSIKTDILYSFDDTPNKISPYDWLDPYMPYIRIALEDYHRNKFGIISSVGPDGSLQANLLSEDTTPSKRIPVAGIAETYDSIVNHLKENSSGRAYLDNGLQFGLDVAYVFARDVFNPRSNYGSPRLRLYDLSEDAGFGSDRERQIKLAKFAAVKAHLGTVDTPSNTGNDSTFSLINKNRRFERESFSFISWGLLEEIVNKQFVSETANFLKMDSSSTKIRFHENLVSTDASVCILPNKNAPKYDKGVLVNGERYDLSINGISHRNVGNQTAGTLEPDEAWLYSIFLNVERVKSVFSRTETLRGAIQELLDYVSGALVDNYEFTLDQRGSTTRVIDVAYSKYDSAQQRYKFKFNQANSFIRAVDVDLNHTVATQMQAIYGHHSGTFNKLQSPFESSITPIVPKGIDRLDLFGDDLISTDTTGSIQDTTAMMDSKPGIGHYNNFWIQYGGAWVNYVYPDRETVLKHMYGSDVKGEAINSGTTVPNLTTTITLDGISGIRYWDAFNLDYVPHIYNEQGFFFVTAIDHVISSGDWSTSVRGNYRIKTISR